MAIPQADRFQFPQHLANAFNSNIANRTDWEVKMYKFGTEPMEELSNSTYIYSDTRFVYKVKVGKSCWGLQDASRCIFLSKIEVLCDDIDIGPVYSETYPRDGNPYDPATPTEGAEASPYIYSKNIGRPHTEYKIFENIFTSQVNSSYKRNELLNSWATGNDFDSSPLPYFNSDSKSIEYTGGLYRDTQYLSQNGISIGGYYGTSRKYRPYLKLTFHTAYQTSGSFLSPSRAECKFYKFVYIPFIDDSINQMRITPSTPYIILNPSTKKVNYGDTFNLTMKWNGLNINANKNRVRFTMKIGDYFNNELYYDVLTGNGEHTFTGLTTNVNTLGRMNIYAYGLDNRTDADYQVSYITYVDIENPNNISCNVYGERGIINSAAGIINDEFTIETSSVGVLSGVIKLSEKGYFNGETDKKDEYKMPLNGQVKVTFDESCTCNVSVVGKINNELLPFLDGEMIISRSAAITVLHNNIIASTTLTGDGASSKRIKDIRVLYNYKPVIGDIDYSNDFSDKGIMQFTMKENIALNNVKNILTNNDLYVGIINEPTLIEIENIRYANPNKIYVAKASSMSSVKYYTKIGTSNGVYTLPAPSSTEFKDLDSTGKEILSTPNQNNVIIKAYSETDSDSALSVAAMIFVITNPFKFNISGFINNAVCSLSAKCKNVGTLNSLLLWDSNSNGWFEIDPADDLFLDSNISVSENNKLSFLNLTKQIKYKRVISDKGELILAVRSTGDAVLDRAELIAWYSSFYMDFDEVIGFADESTIVSKTTTVSAIKNFKKTYSTPFQPYETTEIWFDIPKTDDEIYDISEITGIYIKNPDEVHDENPNLLNDIETDVFNLVKMYAWWSDHEVNNGSVKVTFYSSKAFGRDLAHYNNTAVNLMTYRGPTFQNFKFYVTHNVVSANISSYTQSGSMRPGDFYFKRSTDGNIHLVFKNTPHIPMIGYDGGKSISSPNLKVLYSFVDGCVVSYAETSIDDFVGGKIGQGIDVPPGFPINITYDLKLVDEKYVAGPLDFPNGNISDEGTIFYLSMSEWPSKTYLDFIDVFHRDADEISTQSTSFVELKRIVFDNPTSENYTINFQMKNTKTTEYSSANVKVLLNGQPYSYYEPNSGMSEPEIIAFTHGSSSWSTSINYPIKGIVEGDVLTIESSVENSNDISHIRELLVVCDASNSMPRKKFESKIITGIGCDSMPFRQYLERHLTSSDADALEDKQKRFRLDLVR